MEWEAHSRTGSVAFLTVETTEINHIPPLFTISAFTAFAIHCSGAGASPRPVSVVSKSDGSGGGPNFFC